MYLQNSDSELATAQFSAVHNVVPSNNSLGHKDKFLLKYLTSDQNITEFSRKCTGPNHKYIGEIRNDSRVID
mgnify:CR=1 FL=1